MGVTQAIDPALAPAYGLAVLDALEAAGHEAWFVGGWVRDALRGAPAHDVDVCTDAPWEESERALVSAGITVHETGTAHGTVTAVAGGSPSRSRLIALTVPTRTTAARTPSPS